MATRKRRNPWQPTYGECLAAALGRLLEERFTKWQREIEDLLERGEDVGAAVLRTCLREVEGDLEAARIAATPTPRPQTRSIVEMVKERDGVG